ncbi:MAG: 30S ribosomal protein S10 [Elusimicrobiota bacterium]|nr:30S ribosomal protein S10 [Elusimicrobiota bacterium]
MAQNNKIKLKLKGYDHRMLDKSVKNIVDTIIRTGAQVAGPILLPTQTKKYTVLKSPHVDKRGMEQFEMRIHKRLIYIKKPTSHTVDELGRLELPAGIDVEIKA